MSESIEIKEYKKRLSVVEAAQWDGQLNTVPEIVEWLVVHDPDLNVNANFGPTGIQLQILSQGQLLNVSANDYIVADEQTYGLAVFTQAAFEQLYETA